MVTIGLEASRANKEFKTGTEWYAWHLLQQFKKLDQDNKFVVYYNHDLKPELATPTANFYFKRLKWPFGKLWTHIRLSLELLLHPVDKLFFSNSVPIFTRGQLTVTIHDLGFYKNPKLYHPWERIYQKISHWLAVTKADKIIAISEATKQDIINFFPNTKRRIKVVYNGWDDEEFKPANDEAKQNIREKYDLPRNFFLYIGRLETKKNIQNLIKGYSQLKDKDWPLILAGRPGNYGYTEILELAEKVNNIRFLGYIKQIDYPKLLASASVFIFPSKFEGFGIPILEAMGSGVPVICSDIPVLHEVAKDSVLFFNPDKPQNIADVMGRLIGNSDKRKELIRKGIVRAKQFSWEKCAKETLEYIILDKIA